MTEKKRIFLNVVATYGRSLFALVCGLFTGRWVLMALGETDYGLFGVIAGLTVFLAFFNSILAGAIARFYAVSIGQAKIAQDHDAAIEESRRWFNTALSVHTAIPFILIVVGYPVGMWAVESFLTISPERLEASRWVFRFVCISCFVGMVNVPFQAMYTAKQYIAELTIYSFVTTTLNVGFLYFMVTHPGDWLAKYALWTCLLSVVPQIIICLRALQVFPECRIRFQYWYDKKRLAQVGSYAGWQALGTFCSMLRTQGLIILANKMFGPKVNAAQTVATTVSGHASTLSGALTGAFTPAIVTAYGEGNMGKMRVMALRSCRFALLLSLLFMLPLALELPEIIHLWLKEPPTYAIGLCWCALVTYLIDISTQGHLVAVNARGKIASYQVVLSVVNVFTLPLAYVVIRMGFGVYASLGGVAIVGITLNTLGRLVFARYLTAMSIRKWVSGVVMPIAITTCVSVGCGCVPRLLWDASLLRIVATIMSTLVPFVILSWCMVMDDTEKALVLNKIQTMVQNMRHHS